jgi:hypothetical protein
MEQREVGEVIFRKSSYSDASKDCVEIGMQENAVHVRDSKDPTGPRLTFTLSEWAAFVSGARAGEFDL